MMNFRLSNDTDLTLVCSKSMRRCLSDFVQFFNNVFHERILNLLTPAHKGRYSDLAPEKDGVRAWPPAFRGAYRHQCGFFVRNVSAYGRSVRDTFGCARSTNRVGQPVHSCPPSWPRVTGLKTYSWRLIMSNALVFRDVTFDVRTIRNTAYISSVQLSKALGYSRADAVQKIYNRNKDEFTPEMSVPQIGVAGMDAARLFSLRGAHLVAMFARTHVAKEFRKWVLDVLEKETQENINLFDPDEFMRVREIAGKYLEDVAEKARGGHVTPSLEIPDNVLSGIVAMQMWKNSFTLGFNHEGKATIWKTPDPFDAVTRIIADPGWANLEKIRQVFDACMTALSNRLGVGGTK